ncbi:transcriptional regulator [Campylobacter lari]|uniref:helix-turn-helix transcriptional regulator n=1 Tax=Campylobacter sp. CNRCH_2014_2849 TaxID=2911604 RepID=UPI00138E9BB5|nr:WYL domain-containing protein [Campylobacter sp. CNRCH_2014_2849]EAI3904799.1 transcriptional regulator [Campylobacter lari]EAJ6152801.1 transcriptional regulator [Campylobacter lari]EAJ6187306.1 transcriptional regulator [Campylobacter lari]EAK5577021.1 transcriptional regulator [Campylobacter lari]EGK8036036.1 transcriptional regulator [Campylobacter lari]
MKELKKYIANSKLTRLEVLYEKLVKSENGITIKELAQELNVSAKTIKRDMQGVFEPMGLIKNGRKWRIDTSKDVQEQDDEKIILEVLDTMAKSAGNSFYAKAHPLLSKLSQNISNPIHTSLDAEKLEEKDLSNFQILEQAINTKTQIVFKYENKLFQVKPLKLAFFSGFWYLLVFDMKKRDIFKKFYLKNIQNITLTQEHFQTDESLEVKLQRVNSIWFSLDKPFTVRLLVEEPIRKYFERKPLNSQIITGKDKDGSIEIELEITHEMEILPLVYYYIPYVKVLEPDFIANKVKEVIGEYLDQISK